MALLWMRFHMYRAVPQAPTRCLFFTDNSSRISLECIARSFTTSHLLYHNCESIPLVICLRIQRSKCHSAAFIRFNNQRMYLDFLWLSSPRAARSECVTAREPVSQPRTVRTGGTEAFSHMSQSRFRGLTGIVLVVAMFQCSASEESL